MQKISPDNYLGMCWYTLDPGSVLRDLRAGLSYQSLLENLEPLLYNMVSKLKEDITPEPTISPITVVKIENITDNSSLKNKDKEIPVIKSLDTDVDTLQIIPAVKIETPNESIVIPHAVVAQNNVPAITIPPVKPEQIILASNVITKPEITPISVPTVKIENLKNINENIVTDKTSQITLKVDNTIGRVDNKDTVSKDNQQSISLDKVVNDWRVYWVSSVGFQSNIRSKANVKSDAIGKVEQEETLYYVGKQLLEIDSLGYRWIPISDYSNEKKTNIDIKGWIREDAVRLRRYEFLYNLPVSIIVTVNNASADEVEWIKRKFNSGDIKVEIKVD